MRRFRPLAVVAAPALAAALALSSCSTVSSDAIDVNGTALSRDDFETILTGYSDGVAGSILPNGTINASIARAVLTDWVTTTLYERQLAADGAEVSDADLATAREELALKAGFAKAGESTQNFYVHASAVRSAFEREYGLRDDELKSLYASGPSASGVYCLRGILVADRTKADEASFRLAAGDEFAKVATELSTDATAKNGGILQNPQTGKACIDQAALASQVGPEFISALAGVGIDQPTTPFEIPNVGWVILVMRPFDEVSKDLRDAVKQPGLDAKHSELLASARVSVRSEYGRWDATRGEVVPA